MESAKRHLDTARFLLDHERYTMSVPVAYYAAFNALKALMLALEEYPSNTERYRVSQISRVVSREYVLEEQLPRDTMQQFHAIEDDRYRANYRAETLSREDAQLNLRRARRIVSDAERCLTQE